MFQSISVRIARSCAGLDARGDERGAHAHRRDFGVDLLQPVQRLEQRLERARRQRLAGVARLVRLERVEALRLVDALGLVGEQHGVAVERDAHFVRMRIDARRMRVDDAPRESRPAARARTSSALADRNRCALNDSR